MSKHLADYVVEARVYSVNPENGELKAQGMGIGMKAYNKGNAKKKAKRFIERMPNVMRVEIARAYIKKP